MLDLLLFDPKNSGSISIYFKLSMSVAYTEGILDEFFLGVLIVGPVFTFMNIPLD